MNKLLPLLVALAFISCKQHELTLEELQKAKWDSLSKGIWYISTGSQNGIAGATDSIKLKLKGVAGKELKSLEISFETIPPFAEELLHPILKEKLGDSRSGYLKINFNDVWKPETITGIIYLKGDYFGKWTFSGDSAELVKIPGIRSASFVSKDEGKKKYLADGNGSWEKVLDANPLPNTIDIALEKRDWTEESLTELDSRIRETVVLASSVSLPLKLIKKSDNYFFFEYNRK